MIRPTRRAFLGGLGFAATASLVPLLGSRAQAMSWPRRLIFLFSPNGTIHDAWKPEGGETDFTFGPILEPLTPFQDVVTVLDGLRYRPGGAGNTHMRGPHRFMAGSVLNDGNTFTGGGNASSGWGSHISVDQYVAPADTPFPSLEIGVQNGDANPRSRLAYAGSDQPLAPLDNPYDLYERLFGDLLAEASVVEQRRAERQSVIDLVDKQLLDVQNTYGASAQHKLDAHLQGIRAIEGRLDRQVDETCDIPERGGFLDHEADENYPTVSRLQMDLLVSAMACDQTRVATFMWNRSTSLQTFPWLGFNDPHHDLSHAGDSNTEAQDKLIAINQFYAGELAYLLERLAAVPEGDGTMLDHTLVVWGNELAKGNSHGVDPVPLVLAGGAQGFFRMGRNLTYDSVPNNRLLVSLCHYMGLEDQSTFGNLDDGAGPLPDLV